MIYEISDESEKSKTPNGNAQIEKTQSDGQKEKSV